MHEGNLAGRPRAPENGLSIKSLEMVSGNFIVVIEQKALTPVGE